MTLLQVLLCQLQGQGVLFMGEAGSRMFPGACKTLAMPNWGFFNVPLLFNHPLAPLNPQICSTHLALFLSPQPMGEGCGDLCSQSIFHCGFRAGRGTCQPPPALVGSTWPECAFQGQEVGQVADTATGLCRADPKMAPNHGISFKIIMGRNRNTFSAS